MSLESQPSFLHVDVTAQGIPQQLLPVEATIPVEQLVQTKKIEVNLELVAQRAHGESMFDVLLFQIMDILGAEISGDIKGTKDMYFKQNPFTAIYRLKKHLSQQQYNLEVSIVGSQRLNILDRAFYKLLKFKLKEVVFKE